MDDRRFPDDLPLRPVEPKPDDPTWDLPEERPGSGRLEFDPMEEAGGPAPPPARPDPRPGRPLFFRIALPVAALIALVVFSRDLWWPGEPEAPKAAPKWVAAPHLPADVVPPPEQPVEPSVIEEEEPEVAEAGPVVDDGYDILQTEEIASQEETPAPVAPHRKDNEIAAAAPAPVPRAPALEPEEPAAAPAVKREASPDRPALARRVLPPAPWETGEQPSGLLRPGPGVQEPIPLDLPRYRYPPAARGTGLQVGVRLALLVDERGQVIDAVVREGGPEDLGFDQEALRVARHIPFQPASRHDIPGKMWTEMILEFAE